MIYNLLYLNLAKHILGAIEERLQKDAAKLKKIFKTDSQDAPKTTRWQQRQLIFRPKKCLGALYHTGSFLTTEKPWILPSLWLVFPTADSPMKGNYAQNEFLLNILE